MRLKKVLIGHLSCLNSQLGVLSNTKYTLQQLQTQVTCFCLVFKSHGGRPPVYSLCPKLRPINWRWRQINDACWIHSPLSRSKLLSAALMDWFPEISKTGFCKLSSWSSSSSSSSSSTGRLSAEFAATGTFTAADGAGTVVGLGLSSASVGRSIGVETSNRDEWNN